MRYCISVLVLWFLAAFPGMAHAELDGNEWIRLEESSQISYVVGVYDSWLAMAYAADNILHDKSITVRIFKQAALCMGDTTRVQMTTIVRNHLLVHPEEWTEFMAGLVYSAIQEHCSSKPPPPGGKRGT